VRLVERAGRDESRDITRETPARRRTTKEVPMTKSPVARFRARSLDARGVATAEYAVATAAGCGFAAVLIKLLTSDWGQSLLKTLFDLVLKMIGIG
jgi:hypothetical protein